MKWLTDLLRRKIGQRVESNRGVIVVTITESLRKEAIYVSIQSGADVKQICFPSGYALKLSELLGECFRLSGYEIIGKDSQVSHGDRVTRWELGARNDKVGTV